MKLSHEVSSSTAGPAWGLAFGLLLTAVGIGLWCMAKLSASSSSLDEPVAVASLLIGVFTAIYAAHELRRR
jgi:hypothetical protein